MVRGIVKAPKKASDEDVFQSTMGRVGAFVKENAFTIILTVAVIGAFVVWGISKSGTGKHEAPGWHEIDSNTDPDGLLALADDHSGKPVAKALRMRAADLLFEEYQRDEAAYIGETPTLDRAEAIYRELLEKYGGDEKNDGFIFNVKYSLEKIERERADRESGAFPLVERPEEEIVEEAIEEIPDEPGGADEPAHDESAEVPAACPDCGTEMTEGSNECPSCRAPAGDESTEKPKSP